MLVILSRSLPAPTHVAKRAFVRRVEQSIKDLLPPPTSSSGNVLQDPAPKRHRRDSTFPDSDSDDPDFVEPRSPSVDKLDDCGWSSSSDTSSVSSDDNDSDWSGRKSPYATRAHTGLATPSVASHGDNNQPDNDDDAFVEAIAAIEELEAEAMHHYWSSTTTSSCCGGDAVKSPPPGPDESATPTAAVEDIDAAVYANFLRSLFSECSSPASSSTMTPNKRQISFTEHEARRQAALNVAVDLDAAEDDDYNEEDDPEFDVMAELERLDGEDFVYELRDDRAVRISKREAKTLRRDLAELFTIGDGVNPRDHDHQSVNAEAPSVLAFRSNFRHILQDRLVASASDPSDQQPQPPRKPPSFISIFDTSAAASSRYRDLSQEMVDCSFSASDAVRLQRQLSMHIQLLATTFVLTIDLPNAYADANTYAGYALHELCAHRSSMDCELSSLVGGHSLLWACPALDEALFITRHYIGLSALPRYTPAMVAERKRRGRLPNACRRRRRRRPFSLPAFYPLPLCLIRLMTQSRVWSYPTLMPLNLAPFAAATSSTSADPTTSNNSQISDQRHRRSLFHSSEDALLSLGIIEFVLSNTCVPPDLETLHSFTSSTLNASKSANRRNTCYKQIQSYFLPHRTLLQLRARRWNITGGSCNASSKSCPLRPLSLPSRRLLDILTQRSDCQLTSDQLLQLADEITNSSALNGLALTTNCLRRQFDVIGDDQSPDLAGLPRHVGYEEVLSNRRVPIRCRRSAGLSRRSLNASFASFVRSTKCLFDTDVVMETSDDNATATVKQSDDFALLESAFTDTHRMIYVPAIPINLTPDGASSVDSTNTTLMEVFLPLEALPSNLQTLLSTPPAPPHTTVPLATTVTTSPVVIPSSQQPQLLLDGVVGEQIDALLVKMRTTTVISSTTLQESDAPTLNTTGKLPLPPLSKKLNCEKSIQSLTSSLHQGLDDIQAAHVGGGLKFKPRLENVLARLHHVNNNDASLDVPTPASSAATQANHRFLTRLMARGDANVEQDLVMGGQLSQPNPQQLDQMAHSLLARCRDQMESTSFDKLSALLLDIGRVCGSDGRLSSITDKRRKQYTLLLKHLANVLGLLAKQEDESLYDDFLLLLTPQQAKDLGLLPTYRQLKSVEHANRVLLDLVPSRGKRFWHRLSKMADCLKVVSNQSTNHSNEPSTNTVANDNIVILNKSWSLLEGAFKNRPLLLTRLASALDDQSKPYSGHEDAFEECDALARNPTPNLSTATDANMISSAGLNSSPFVSDDGWENCDALSSSVSRGIGGKSWSHTLATCPCSCHHRQLITCTSKRTSRLIKQEPGERIKSNPKRHCFACSLKVVNGTIYSDESDSRLRPVRIEWLPDFQPPHPNPSSSATSKSTNQQQTPTTTSHSHQNKPLGSILHRLLDSSNDGSAKLPDMSGRRFIIQQSEQRQLAKSPLDNNDDNDDQPIALTTTTEPLPHPPPPPPTQDQALDLSTTTPIIDIVGHDDDQAACFNTEAFSTRLWTVDDDRRVLEFAKSRGSYRPGMFDDLASSWPRGPSADQLQTRFMQLMVVALGDAYDSTLFGSVSNTPTIATTTD